MNLGRLINMREQIDIERGTVAYFDYETGEVEYSGTIVVPSFATAKDFNDWFDNVLAIESN